MAAVAKKRYSPFLGGSTSRQIEYVVTAATDDNDALAAVAAVAPGTHASLALTDIYINDQLDESIFIVVAQYGSLDAGPLTPPFPEDGSVEYEFSFRAEAVHIDQTKYSKKTVAYSVDTKTIGGEVQGSPPPNNDKPFNFKGAIGVTEIEGGKQRVEGVDLEVPPITNVWTFYPLNALVTQSYQADVEQIMGHVNSTPLFNRPPGTMRLVGVTGGVQNSERWRLRFEFSYQRNRTVLDENALEIGDIEDIEKPGHHLIWYYYNRKLDADKRLIVYPRFVYVEQVFEQSDLFGILQLPTP